MVQVRVRSETAIPQGWRYVVELEHADGRRTTHAVRLAWVDHNHWSGDRAVAPSRVAEALLECLSAAGLAGELPARFDAATARRLLPGLDERLRGVL